MEATEGRRGHDWPPGDSTLGSINDIVDFSEIHATASGPQAQWWSAHLFANSVGALCGAVACVCDGDPMGRRVPRMCRRIRECARWSYPYKIL